MKKDLFSLREEEIFLTLKELKECNFIVIGGYAVNAYALPRFSADCDIVIKDEKELDKIGKILIKRGYEKEELNEKVQYFGAFCRYEKKLENNFSVGMDVLIRNVTDRMSDAVFSAEWIFENSNRRVLKGKTITEELNLRIINIDALLVMKIISCRATDIRDVFMMMPNARHKDWIKSEIARRYDFNEKINKIIEKVSSEQFKDGISGVYGSFDAKVFEKHKKAIMRFLSK
ncbi:MAG: hypothetical protein NTZ02_00660 [Candidatus Woesearchaeota archaeon]|nr:hypothetical protein [Candidatus Woesearchaeota archaeon]